MARKPLDEKTVAENCLKWGVGGINIDESRVGTDEIQTNHYNTIGDMTSFHQSQAGNNYDISKHIGRFPANLIHDGSDEVVDLFPNSKSTPGVRHNKNTSSILEKGFEGAPLDIYSGHSDSGSASRFFYCAKASKSERNKGCDDLEEKTPMEMTGRKEGSEGLLRVREDGSIGENAFAGKSASSKNHHPTVKPIALMEYLVKLVSRE